MADHDSLFEEDALPPAEEPADDTEPTQPSKQQRKQQKMPKFEEALERLEEIVAEMESGELSLEDSMTRFEEGARLAAHCRKSLGAIEKRVEVLVRKQGSEAWEEFSDGSESR